MITITTGGTRGRSVLFFDYGHGGGHSVNLAVVFELIRSFYRSVKTAGLQFLSIRHHSPPEKICLRPLPPKKIHLLLLSAQTSIPAKNTPLSTGQHL